MFNRDRDESYLDRALLHCDGRSLKEPKLFGRRNFAKQSATAMLQKHAIIQVLGEVFERLLVQAMSFHLPVESFVINVGFFRGRGNTPLMLYQ
jgi:hypothetical protein